MAFRSLPTSARCSPPRFAATPSRCSPDSAGDRLNGYGAEALCSTSWRSAGSRDLSLAHGRLDTEPGGSGRCPREFPSPPSVQCRMTTGYFRCLLYTSDAADDLLCVDLGGRRIIKK